MAPLPVSNTGRYWLEYTSNGEPHAALFRYDSPLGTEPPPSGLIELVGSLLEALDPWLPTDFQINSSRYSPSGTVISLPGTFPVVDVGTIAPNGASKPAFIGMKGRTGGGRMGGFWFYGAGFVAYSDSPGISPDYRVQEAESAVVAAVLDELDPSGLVGIDNLPLNWYRYANIGFGAYWQKRVRT